MILQRQLIEHEGQLAVKQIIPKNFLLSDYSSTENLIELENIEDGERYWVPVERIFRSRFYKIGHEIKVVRHGSNIITGEGVVTAILDRISAVTERKRCYVLAVLNITKTGLEAVRS